MKILHVNFSDNNGGAAIAALRLVKAELTNCLNVEMLVVYKETDFIYIKSISSMKRVQLWVTNKISSLIINKINKSTNPILHSTNLLGAGLHNVINQSDCDIVHLHWICFEMLSISEIKKIRKPIVWTLHDSWPICGAEHHPNGMNDFSYVTHYKPNPYNGININSYVLSRKFKYWKNKNINIVSPSNWLASCVSKSSLFSTNKSHIIPNCLDVNIFKPNNKNVSKEILGLDPSRKYILFGADGGATNKIKGADLLLDIIKEYLKINKINIELLVFGTSHFNKFDDLENINIRYLGKIKDEYTMSLLYNASDVTLVPSRIDNLPQVATESISCGVPVVCFNVGGLPDIIDHKINGYIAERFNCEDFAYGINWVLTHENYSELSLNARNKALGEYNEEKCVNQYKEIYAKILANE